MTFLQENNSLITGELELKLKIPVTSLLLGVLPSEPFADLIASGQLMYDSSLCLPCDDFNEVSYVPFEQISYLVQYKFCLKIRKF